MSQYARNDRRHFSKFVTKFGGGFKNRQHKLIEGRNGHTVAGMAVETPDTLPGNFIRMDVGEGDYLFTMATFAKEGIVELGRMDGGSTLLLTFAAQVVPIWSIDLAPTDDQRLLKYLNQYELARPNVRLLIGNSKDSWPEIGSFDLLFVDGDHGYEGCLADLTSWWPRLSPGGHVVLHDCISSSAVTQAIVDFVDNHSDASYVRGPYLPSANCYHDWSGTMAHLRKKL